MARALLRHFIALKFIINLNLNCLGLEELFLGNICLLGILKKRKKHKNDCEYCDSLLSSTKDCTCVSVCTRISYSACIFNYMCSTLVFRLLCNKPIFCLQLRVKLYLSKKSRSSVRRRISLPERLTTE